ncbi:DMT family transporter [uncultured Tateyamaria sp.]|uniref:DMT family transporter n=1 Tax=uncultured Tateyamaria sp. TaxID=455651 RepID=UPI002634D30B|nr:DMT family transporter [uncultured Tateyamaria sp.]
MPRIGFVGRRTVRTSAPRLMGYAWMAVAITIWASWLVLTSSGVTTALSPVDLAGLRALVPAVVLAPLLWRQRYEVARLGLQKSLLLSLYGAPFTLCVGYGLSYAPVAHAGAMVPSLMPVFVLFIGWIALGQRVSAYQLGSAVLIIAGAAAIVFRPAEGARPDNLWIGHGVFLAGAFFWACFTLTLRQHAISPFLATALVGAISTLCLAPFWVMSGLSTMGAATPPDIAFQFVFQGVITGLVSLYAFGEALRVLGLVATRLAAFTPAVATCLAIPILSQVPDAYEIAAIGLVVGGLLVASLPARAVRSAASERGQSPDDPRCRKSQMPY